jgi:uncharacterized membrane protein
VSYLAHGSANSSYLFVYRTHARAFLTRLGALGDLKSFAYGINASGQVVGASSYLAIRFGACRFYRLYTPQAKTALSRGFYEYSLFAQQFVLTAIGGR